MRRSIADIIGEAEDEILEAFKDCCGRGHPDISAETVTEHAGLALVRYMWQVWGEEPTGFGFRPEDLDAVLSSGD